MNIYTGIVCSCPLRIGGRKGGSCAKLRYETWNTNIFVLMPLILKTEHEHKNAPMTAGQLQYKTGRFPDLYASY